MKFTKDARTADILEHYGDNAEVMVVFGGRRVGR
jgi:hypothetical protein